MKEDPFVKEGYGSAPFDDEGVRPSKRFFVENGSRQGIFPFHLFRKKAWHEDYRECRRPYNISLHAEKEHEEMTLEKN